MLDIKAIIWSQLVEYLFLKVVMIEEITGVSSG